MKQQQQQQQQQQQHQQQSRPQHLSASILFLMSSDTSCVLIRDADQDVCSKKANNKFSTQNRYLHTFIHHDLLPLLGVSTCGQKRHTHRIDCRPAKSHERLHVGTCGHRQETFNYIHHVTALRRIVIRTSKSAPQTTVLEQFHLHMCVSPQCQAIFPQ